MYVALSMLKKRCNYIKYQAYINCKSGSRLNIFTPYVERNYNYVKLYRTLTIFDAIPAVNCIACYTSSP
jgi:hypothetical protein